MTDIVFDNLVFDRLREIGDQSQRIGELAAEIARLRLTEEERAAVDRQAKWLFNQAKNKPDIHSADLLLQEAATLRGLLSRTGDCPTPDNAADRNNGTTGSE